MVRPKYLQKGAQIIAPIVLSSLCYGVNVYAQDALPVPGSAPYGESIPSAAKFSAPVPGTVVTNGANVAPGLVAGGAYDKLPLNPGNATARLEELRNLMPNSRAKDFQDSISGFSEWLSDMADAHWRLYQSFNKVDGAKAQAESERQLCLKFGQIKRQSMLLKAEFLISQRRYPEALSPLVDIVSAEPKTETGRSAYKLLQEIGFSDTSLTKADNASTVTPVITPISAPAAPAGQVFRVSAPTSQAKQPVKGKPN